MGDRSGIEWTDLTLNLHSGCSRVSAGCQRCYAENIARRFAGEGLQYEGLIHPKTGGWNGIVRFHPEMLEVPLRKKRARKIFINSMSDLFHESVPFETIAAVFAMMASSQHHTYQVLTKRAQRMHDFFLWLERGAAGDHQDETPSSEAIFRYLYAQSKPITDQYIKVIGGLKEDTKQAWPLCNVWLGVSVENQDAAEERIPWLLRCPAAIHWLSCEPLLAALNLRRIWVEGYGYLDALTPGYYTDGRPPRSAIRWVVTGGESGAGARPTHPYWIRSLRDQCEDTGVAFFFKQWGAHRPATSVLEATLNPIIVSNRSSGTGPNDPKASRAQASTNRYTSEQIKAMIDGVGDMAHVDCAVVRVGKKAAGKLLDGRLHTEFPA